DDEHRHDHQAEQLDPDRQADRAPGPAGALAAVVAVGRVEDQRGLAPIAGRLLDGAGHGPSIGPLRYTLMAVTGELGREEVVVLLGVVPERIGDLVSGLDEPRLAYRHAPAFPTLKEVIGHLCDAGVSVDSLLRRAYLDGQRELPVRASIDPRREPDLSPSLTDLLEGFGRVRRRTVDL